MVSASTTGTETHDASQPQELQGCCNASGEAHPLPDRSPDQWKIIRKLKLCAGCLTRTVPPHTPCSDGAPCKGQPKAPFDDTKIKRIKKEVLKRRADLERTYGKHGQQNRQTWTGNVSSTARQHGHCLVPPQYSPYVGTSQTVEGPPVLGNRYGVPATPGHIFATAVPPYDFHCYSSFLHPRERLYRSNEYARRTVTRSSGSVTETAVADELCIVRTPQYSYATMKTNVKQSTERNVDFMGMDPPTPVIPAIHIETEIGPAHESQQEVAGVPVPESSASAFGLSVNDHNWDGETEVAESTHGPEDKDTVEEDLTTSALLVEKLLRKTERIMSSVPRSWTLQVSPVSLRLFHCIFKSGTDAFQGCHYWEGSTIFDEPQEFLSKHIQRKEVLLSSRSVESFFDIQRITPWL